VKIYDVKCPGCGEIFFETTHFYEMWKAANGRMFKLKHPYGETGYNWTTFPADTSCQFADLACPQCGTSIVSSTGRVALLYDPETGKRVSTTPKTSKKKKKEEPVSETTPDENSVSETAPDENPVNDEGDNNAKWEAFGAEGLEVSSTDTREEQVESDDTAS
jgi:ribosomal protein S27E